MMRRMIGDEVFFPALRAYITAYGKSSAQTYQFMEFLESQIPNPPVAWSTFFDQWLVKAGHPIFDAVIRPLPGGAQYAYRVTISQTQSAANVPDVFSMPVRVRIVGPDATRDTVLVISQRTQTVDIDLGWTPRGLVIDPDNDILCEKQSSVVSVDGDVQESTQMRVLGPHPVPQGQPLRVMSSFDGRVSVRIVSVTGEVVAALDLPSGVSHVNTSQFMPGTYVLTTAGARFDIHLPFIVTGR